MATSEEVLKIIDEHCTSKYFIEYDGFLTNHLAHGIIALHRLGASEARLDKFIQWYAPRLQSPSKFSFEEETNSDVLNVDKSQQLLGKREEFYSLLNKYKELLKCTYSSNLDGFIRTEFPKLMDGLHCAALHPVIHLGYGFSVRSHTLVVEGMAYLHYSHMATKPIPRSASERNVDIVDALSQLRDSPVIREKMKMYVEHFKWMPNVTGSFQREVGILQTHPWLRGRIQVVVESIKFPDWFEISTAGIGDMLRLMDTVLHWALLAYACAEKRNDFFLLHGVTGAWSLLQILHTFVDPSQAFDSIQYFLATLLSAYLAQGCPAINLTLLDQVPLTTLDEIRHEAVAMTVDEHVYKLVQICYELGKKNSDDEKQKLYKVASRVAMDYDLSLSSNPKTTK